MSRKPTFDDLVTREARLIATDQIERALARQNLPLPRDGALTIHIDQLLALKPEIRLEAEERVRASRDAHTLALRAIGISPTDPKSPEIDIEEFEL